MSDWGASASLSSIPAELSLHVLQHGVLCAANDVKRIDTYDKAEYTYDMDMPGAIQPWSNNCKQALPTALGENQFVRVKAIAPAAFHPCATVPGIANHLPGQEPLSEQFPTAVVLVLEFNTVDKTALNLPLVHSEALVPVRLLPRWFSMLSALQNTAVHPHTLELTLGPGSRTQRPQPRTSTALSDVNETILDALKRLKLHDCHLLGRHYWPDDFKERVKSLLTAQAQEVTPHKVLLQQRSELAHQVDLLRAGGKDAISSQGGINTLMVLANACRLFCHDVYTRHPSLYKKHRREIVALAVASTLTASSLYHGHFGGMDHASALRSTECREPFCPCPLAAVLGDDNNDLVEGRISLSPPKDIDRDTWACLQHHRHLKHGLVDPDANVDMEELESLEDDFKSLQSIVCKKTITWQLLQHDITNFREMQNEHQQWQAALDAKLIAAEEANHITPDPAVFSPGERWGDDSGGEVKDALVSAMSLAFAGRSDMEGGMPGKGGLLRAASVDQDWNVIWVSLEPKEPERLYHQDFLLPSNA